MLLFFFFLITHVILKMFEPLGIYLCPILFFAISICQLLGHSFNLFEDFSSWLMSFQHDLCVKLLRFHISHGFHISHISFNRLNSQFDLCFSGLVSQPSLASNFIETTIVLFFTSNGNMFIISIISTHSF